MLDNAILLVILIFLFFTEKGRLFKRSMALYFVIMFPNRKWHLPKWLSPKINIEEYLIKIGNRKILPDIYRPNDNKKYPGMIVFAPLAKEGKREPLVVNFMKGLVGLGFTVMVPFWPNRSVGTIYESDSNDLIECISWFSKSNHIKNEPIGIVAVSYGTGPAIIACANNEIQEKIRFLMSISGYIELLSVAKLVVTKQFSYKNISGSAEPDPYARYILFRNAGNWCESKKDTKIFYKLAQNYFTKQNPDKELDTTKDSFSKDGRKVFDWVTSKTPQEFDNGYLKMSNNIKKYYSGLSVSDKLIKSINFPLLILHSTNDRLIPYTESVKLYDKIEDKKDSTLVLIDAFDHTVPVPATLKNIWTIYLPNLVRIVKFIFKMLEISIKKSNKRIKSKIKAHFKQLEN